MRVNSRRLWISAAAGCALFAAPAAFAMFADGVQEAPAANAAPAFAPPTVAVFDLEKLLAGSRRRGEMEDELKRAFAQKKVELEKLTTEVKKHQEELAQLKEGSQRQHELERLIHQKRADLEYTEKQYTEEIDDMRAERFVALLGEVQEVVARHCESRGIDLVLQRKLTLQDGMPSWEAVFHATPALDITNDLIEILNKQ